MSDLSEYIKKSDRKCPICQTQLDVSIVSDKVFGCPKCRNMGNAELWDELGRARKALDIAVDALNYANKCIKGSCVNWETHIDKALEQIKDKEQQ